MIKEHRPQNNRVIPRQQWLPFKLPLFIAEAIICLLLSSLTASAATTSKGMIGFNWPDMRDNYSYDLLVPGGLDRTDSKAVIVAKTERLVHQAHGLTGANTFRMPINYLMPKTDMSTAAGQWWDKYCASIDKITSMGHNVIICPWHIRDDTFYQNIPFAPGSMTHPTSTAQMFTDIKYFWDMWQVVVSRYATNPRVHFEIWNEPGQCTKQEWTDICTEWLRRYPATTVPRNRVIIDGGDWAEFVGWVAYNPTFSDCLLAYHMYGNLKNYTTEAQWTDQFDFDLGVDTTNYPASAAAVLSRVIVDEYASAGRGTADDYSDPSNIAPAVVFMRALNNYITKHNMGAIGWGMCGAAPLMVTNSDNHSTTPYLMINNTSYLSSFIEGFNFSNYSGSYKIRNKRAADKYLYRNGTDINAAPDWGQTWAITDVGNGFYRITSGSYYLCATSTQYDGGTTNTRTLAALLPSNNVIPANSLWKIVEQGDGTVKFWNKNYPLYSPHYTTVPLTGSNYQYRVNNEYISYGLWDYTSWVLLKQ